MSIHLGVPRSSNSSHSGARHFLKSQVASPKPGLHMLASDSGVTDLETPDGRIHNKGIRPFCSPRSSRPRYFLSSPFVPRLHFPLSRNLFRHSCFRQRWPAISNMHSLARKLTTQPLLATHHVSNHHAPVILFFLSLPLHGTSLVRADMQGAAPNCYGENTPFA